MLTTIKDPRIAQGFSALANVLGGGRSAEAAINADLAARKRDLLVAQTEMQRREEQALRNRMADTTMLQSDIASTTDYTDPAKLALILSNLPGMGADAMKAGPGFVAGAGTLVDPNFRNGSDFSRVLLGTGVVSDYANTPDGMAAGHQNDVTLRRMQEEGATTREQMGNDAAYQQLIRTLTGDIDIQQMKTAQELELRRMQEQAALARQDDEQDFRVQHPALGQGGAGAPPTVSPNTVDDLWSLVAGRLGLSEEMMADPATQNAILPRLVEVYQQTKSAEAAIQQIMKEFTVREESDRGFLPWNWFDTKQTVARSAPVTAAPAADKPAAGVVAPAPAAGPSAPPAPPARGVLDRVRNKGEPQADPYPEGTIIRNPQTGERMIRKGGQWVGYAG